jgi:adenine-specific DNA-methyltransferase
MRQFDHLRRLIEAGADPADVLSEVSSLETRFGYGLVWDEEHPENEEAFEEAARNGYPILREASGNNRVPPAPGRQTHVLIRGENYHTLSVLRYSHPEAFDVIYIDPPYNTEEAGFRYNDRRVIKDDPFRDTKWLSFMKKRLLLARTLLKPHGVIFISIDDNEFAPLKLLLDTQIFGPGHCLGVLTWIKRTKPINSGKARFQIQQKVEYVLAYSPTKKKQFPGFELSDGAARRYTFQGQHGLCRLEGLLDSDNGRKQRQTMRFPLAGVRPPKGQRWKIGEETARELEAAGMIEVVGGMPNRAIYPADEHSHALKPFWSHIEDTGSAEDGKQTLTSLIGPGHGFDTVKPVGLMTALLSHFPKDAKVLDFFAGSGTTLHAVAELNADGGTRQAVLVTDNEDNICDEVCLPRVRAVLDEVHPDSDGMVLLENAFVNRRCSEDQLKRRVARACFGTLCLKDGCFPTQKEVVVGEGWQFGVADGRGIALYAETYDGKAVKALAAAIKAAEVPTTIYAFSYTGTAVDVHLVKALAPHPVRPVPHEMIQIFKAIYE